MSRPAPAVLLEDVRKTLGGKTVLDGLRLAVEPAETLAILGPSGSGKSVLLKHIVGLIRPDAGRIRVCETDLATADRATLLRLRRRIGYLFQGAALLNSLTVFDNVALPLRERERPSEEEVRREVEDRLARVGLPEAADKFPAELSGGMRKRAGLARAIMGRPELLLYDEPTAGLDPPGAAAIGELLRELQRSMRLTSIVVTHDLDLVVRVADRVAFLHEGKIRMIAPRRDFERSSDPVLRDFMAAAGNVVRDRMRA